MILLILFYLPVRTNVIQLKYQQQLTQGGAGGGGGCRRTFVGQVLQVDLWNKLSKEDLVLNSSYKYCSFVLSIAFEKEHVVE